MLSLNKAFALCAALITVSRTVLAAPHASTDTRHLLERNNNGKIPDLLTATLDEIAAGLSSGAFTSVQLTTAYLARITEVNNLTHAIIETNPYALGEAAKADQARKSGKAGTSPLYGVPIIVKDNIATARPE